MTRTVGGRLVRPEAWRLGLVVGTVGGIVMAVVAATSPSGSVFRSDALYFRLVAEHPFGHSAALAAHATTAGDAYRYGRVLYPYVAWVLALTRPAFVHWTLPVVDVVALGFLVAFAAELVARRGEPVDRALVVLLVPGIWLSVAIAFSEVFVLALVLLLLLLVVADRRGAAYVVGALALLARETSGALAIAPMAVRAVWRRRWKEAGGWALTAVPLLAWWVWVRHRTGVWPPLDRSISRREATSYPFGGVIRVVHEGAHASHVVAFALGAVTVGLAVWAWRRVPWFPVADAALAFGLLILVLGPNAWRYAGEVIRLMAPAQVLALLTMAARAPRPVPG